MKCPFHYISAAWDCCSDALKKKLDTLHRRSIKLMLPDINLTTNQRFEKLKILSLKNQHLFNKGVFMYKAINHKFPGYVTDLFPRRYSLGVRGSGNLIGQKRPRIDMYKTSVAYSGSGLWNNLPSTVRSSPSLNVFKKRLSQYLSTVKQ